MKLVILNDNSSPTQVDTNYTQLITVKHVALTFGPFSTLLTAPSAEVAHRYGFAFVEGAGGGGLVFSEKLPNVFDVSLPVANELDPFTNWIKALPAGQRPATAAYPMANDPFATPQVQLRTEDLLQPPGSAPSTARSSRRKCPDYTAPTPDLVAGEAAQTRSCSGPPTYRPSPRSCTASSSSTSTRRSSSPRQGRTRAQSFLSAVGRASVANGMMVPNALVPRLPERRRARRWSQEYIAKYGGTASDVNADVAEAYSVGEVTAALAVKATGGTTGSKITAYLHSSVTLPTVQGPVQFNSARRERQGDPRSSSSGRTGSSCRCCQLGATGSVHDPVPEAQLVR